MKAYITVGIPCSGKSTWASEYKSTNGNVVEINRDDIRFDLFKMNHYNEYKFSKEKEKKVTERADELLTAARYMNADVIFSDTNLNSGRRDELQKKLEGMGYEVEIKDFTIEFFDALKRNDKRAAEKTIPRKVMYDMYRRYMKYLEEKGEWVKYKHDLTKPVAYIVDIDGTIATNDGHRGWYDWDKVGDDEPIEHVLNVLDDLNEECKIILLSGRDSICRKETLEWLEKHQIRYDGLFMRPAGSMEKDRYVKEKLFWDHVAPYYDVQGVFDDRPQVALLWYDLGLTVFKVGDPLLEF